MESADRQNQPRLPVYLDYQATTPMDPRAFAVMAPYFTEKFANPHSVEHAAGRAVAEDVEAARREVAALIGADPREIVFTSGATEANNLAIKGAARFAREHRGKDHVITLQSEHKCVLESMKRLEREGFRLTVLPVGRDGLADLDQLTDALDEKTALVSVMSVNNEIGVIQPTAAIAALCHEAGALFHSDAAQAAGKIALSVEEEGVDLMSLSGHKLYGPKGIGVLYVRRRPRARLEPMMDGGGQERGLRSGTLPAPLVIGLGEACRLAREERESEAERLLDLRARLFDGLTARIEGVSLNGSPDARIPGNLNLRIDGVDAQALIAEVPELSFSTGSACSSAEVEPSYVLRALGLGEGEARECFRLALGRFSSEAEVDFAVEALAGGAARVRKASKGAA